MYELCLQWDSHKEKYNNEISIQAQEKFFSYFSTKGVTILPERGFNRGSEINGFLLQHKLGSFYIYDVPYNCGLLHMACVSGSIPQLLWKELLSSLSLYMGYSEIQYVVADWQEELYKHLKKLGFNSVCSFHNNRSGNYNRILTLNIKETLNA